ncbi:uncharacterized protein LOC115349662 [Aquila chrysaetos chrysaetos]|uniref:uncharacterized protein LOC115349662 n=1 Tax=Aquila chrysaetos chrysaetos TaxID=223781 RepID=UPI00117654C3|nr:uncharacterized protein LOC115349662 [Aquila chrysaetos chrysaetos]
MEGAPQCREKGSQRERAAPWQGPEGGGTVPIRPSVLVTADGPCSDLSRGHRHPVPIPWEPWAAVEGLAVPGTPPSSAGCPARAGGGGWLGGGRGVGPRQALTPSRLLFPAFWLCRGPWGPGSVCDGRDGVGPESILSYCRFLPELQITDTATAGKSATFLETFFKADQRCREATAKQQQLMIPVPLFPASAPYPWLGSPPAPGCLWGPWQSRVLSWQPLAPRWQSAVKVLGGVW